MNAPHDGLEHLDLTMPEGGYELYRHKNAARINTQNWHGLYWARRNKEGDYELQSVPRSEGEHPAPGGVFPKEGFERCYEKVYRS
jgi:hypothetical protein